MAAITSVQPRRIRSAPAQVKTRAREMDWVLVGVVLALTTLGLIMAYSTTFFWSFVEEGTPWAKFARQLAWAALGLAGMAVVARIDYIRLRRLSVPLMAVCLLTLLVVDVVGADRFGAIRTLLEGSIQPSEVAKIAILAYAATWLASRRDQVQSMAYGLLPFGVIVGMGTFLIAIQPDLSTTVIIVLAAAAMFFVAGASVAQIVLVGGIAGGAFMMLVSVFQHASKRMEDFMRAISDPTQDATYQIQQGLIAFGNGGFLGKGIGASYQKFGLLPTPHTDSVFAVLGEEMGWLGVVATMALFALFAYRAIRIARNADTAFGAFLAIGLMTWIVGQTLANVMAMMALLPLPGVPVPFLSLGGSSLVSILVACGLLLSISRGSRLAALEAENRGEDIRGKARGYRANSAVSRRNSRPRIAGSDRAAMPEDADDTVVIGRDASFGAGVGQYGRPRTPARRYGIAGALRRRRGGNGARPGAPRWR